MEVEEEEEEEMQEEEGPAELCPHPPSAGQPMCLHGFVPFILSSPL